MTEQLEKVLEGKPLLIKNNKYLSTRDYVSPFVERLSPFTNDFTCQVKIPDTLSDTNDEPDIIYTRVHIQAVFPKSSQNSYRKVVGMAYGLDLKKPVVKFYVGALDNDHNDFIAFDKTNLIIQEIEPDTPINYTCIQSLIEKTDYISTMLDQLQSTFITKQTFLDSIGDWIDKAIDSVIVNVSGKIKLSPSNIIEAHRLLFKDADSEFFIQDLNGITVYDIYLALLGIIRDDDKDICNKFEKTLLVNKILSL